VEGVAEAEAEGRSPRRQRREESEKRLRGREGSSGLVMECMEAVGCAPRCETEPRRRSRPLLVWEMLPDEEGCGRVSEDLDRGGLEMSTTERWNIERELDGIRRWLRV
jgi:hypothetical protein